MQEEHVRSYKEVWQTTNQQPWVYALSAGLITAKTRVAQPHVPKGATVLLHASKSRLWPHWRGLEWVKDIDPKKWERGKIVAIATVANVGLSRDLLSDVERQFWDVSYDTGDCRELWYNSAAEYCVRFSKIVALKNPVEAKGMLTPFARAKEETIAAVIKANPEVKDRLSLLTPLEAARKIAKQYGKALAVLAD